VQRTSEVIGNNRVIESEGTEPFKYEIPYVIGIAIALLLIGFVAGTVIIPVLAATTK
jgi:hypothetical protein